MSESRPDPRKRPPDPAGTQPKVDPSSLRAPTATPRAALPAGAEAQPGAAALATSATTPATAAATPTTLGAALADPLAASPADDSAAAVSGSAPAKRRPPTRPGPYAPRFQMLFGALGALSVAALALAVLLARSPAAAPERPWSSWHPASNGVDPAQQIAAYVAPQYRLADGKQIVEAVGGPPSLKGQPLNIGIVHSGQTPALLEGNNVLYQLCGDGVDCSIKEGKPSFERGLLVEREALELALYTFRYVSGVDRVFVTMPPAPPGSTIGGSREGASSGAARSGQGSAGRSSGSAASGGSSSATAAGSSQASATTSIAARVPRHVILFTAQDLSSQLSRPLSTTLSAVTPQVAQIPHWPDTATVAALVAPRLYDFTVSEAQQELVMLLEPVGLGG